MSDGFSGLLRPRLPGGAASGVLQPALSTGYPPAAEAQFMIATRSLEARAAPAAPSAFFERASRFLLGPAEAAPRVWSDFDDNAHANRRAPPGRDPGGGGQGK